MRPAEKRSTRFFCTVGADSYQKIGKGQPPTEVMVEQEVLTSKGANFLSSGIFCCPCAMRVASPSMYAARREARNDSCLLCATLVTFGIYSRGQMAY